MAVDTVIKNSKIVYPHGITHGGVAVDKGVIVSIAQDPNLPQGDRTIDAKGNYLIPGIIDPHVHLGMIFPFENDCEPETRAAAIGGVTTIVTLLGIGKTYYEGSYKDKAFFNHYKSIIEQHSMVDVAFSLAPNNKQHFLEIPEYAQELGMSCFKFLPGWKGETGKKIGIVGADDAMIFEALKIVGEIGYPAMVQVHAENVELAGYFQKKMMDDGRTDLGAWTEARPNVCCIESTMRNIYYAKLLNSILYIVHMSTGEEVDVVRRAKSEGVHVIAETCPHYLVLNKKAKLGQLGKVSPALKSQEDSDKLWWGINEGIVECIGSDNVPTTRKVNEGTIWEITGGYPSGTATLLPVMLSEGVNKGKISLEKLVEVCCYNNAKIFGMYPKKGTVSIGSDADLVIVDMNREVTIKPELFKTATDYTVYDGLKVRGWPLTTMIRGNIVVEDGEIVGELGKAEYVPRRALCK